MGWYIIIIRWVLCLNLRRGITITYIISLGSSLICMQPDRKRARTAISKWEANQCNQECRLSNRFVIFRAFDNVPTFCHSDNFVKCWNIVTSGLNLIFIHFRANSVRNIMEVLHPDHCIVCLTSYACNRLWKCIRLRIKWSYSFYKNLYIYLFAT